MAIPSDPGSEALHRLKATDPPQWLAPSAALSQTARAASQHLFSSLRPYAPKSPFEQLLVEGFDAEQIWQQIDLQSQPLLLSLERELKRFEKHPEEIRKLTVVDEGGEKKKDKEEEEEGEKMEVESDDLGEDMDGFDEEFDDDEDGEGEEEEGEDGDGDGDADGDGEGEGEGEDEDGKDGDGGGGIEDQFLKIKELEEFLEDDEAREYGLKKKDKKKKVDDQEEDSDEEEEGDEGEDEEDEDEDSDEMGEFGLDDDEEDEETDKLGNARYEDFFGGKKKKPSKRKSKLSGDSEDSGMDDDDDENQKTLSTHEKELAKLKSKIEQMERSNLEPKTWTMQGEVTAAKRPKNSALEVDLDFEHNVRPPPVITEEVTASLEDMIKKRILEGHFDDVQKPPPLPSKAPREVKELDENKSKKGLAEIYEEEYVQKTNLASTPLSFAEEEKKEASMLFKKLCLKLDALSHFHFTPKPVIEDMSVQANIPALAMEEIAPVAVSDAAMLAPEEVFTGKGDIKEESELTQAERKRRRANKKRKFKAEAAKRTVNKLQDGTLLNNDNAETAKRSTKKARE